MKIKCESKLIQMKKEINYEFKISSLSRKIKKGRKKERKKERKK